MAKRRRPGKTQPPEKMSVEAMTAHQSLRRTNANPSAPELDGAPQALDNAVGRLNHAASKPEDFFQANDGVAQVCGPGTRKSNIRRLGNKCKASHSYREQDLVVCALL